MSKHRIMTNGERFKYQTAKYKCGLFGRRFSHWHDEYVSFDTYDECAEYIRRYNGQLAEIEDRKWRPV